MSEQTATVVFAESRTQAGHEILVGRCPKCSPPGCAAPRDIGLSGEGKILCACGTLLEFKKASKPK